MMELNKAGLSRNLICIEYPGIVNNVDKMLETLGGLRNISTVCSGKNRRLELYFRPDDVYCKPACGDRYKTNGILLKIKVLKRKKKTGEDISEKPIVKSVEIFGHTQLSFKFKSICDFQYLPMQVNENGEMESVCHSLKPPRFDQDHLLNWLAEPANYFLPPPTFSRVDSVSFNSYMYKKENMDTGPNAVPGPLIGRTRKRRSGHAIFVSFNVANIPTKPREKALKFLEIKFLNDDPLSKIRKCFEERPVWSKLALTCITKFQHDQMKFLLPAVAYYFITGPFRIMWVRFGYDPRKDPSARIFQTLDYRIRAPAGLLSLVKAKRSTNLMPSKSSHPGAKSVVITKELISATSSEGASESNLKDDEYMFYPNRIPPARQMFYQYCDVKAPEIEAMLARLPKLPSWTKCDPRLGWLPPGFDNQCRDIINNHVMKLLKKDMNMDSFKEEVDIDDSTDEGARWEEEFDDEEVDNESEAGV